MIRWDEVGAKLDSVGRRTGIVLSTHVDADGDGLGSQIGLYHFLKARGHTVSIINNDPVPQRYRFLEGSGEVLVYEAGRSGGLIRSAGLFFVLDNSSPKRIGRLLPDLERSRAFKICIDHHVTADPFWDLNCVDESAAASGQLVYQAIKALGGEITPAIARALYVAFVTDTGHFRFPKTTPEVLRINAELMQQGSINPHEIYRALFEGVSRGLTRMISHVLADAQYDFGGRLAWARLTKRQLEECKGQGEDTGNLINMLLAVEGVEASVLFKELPGGETKVSLRSRGSVDVNRVAAGLGGGGHKNASGVLLVGSLDESVRKVIEGMKEVLGPA